MRRFDLRTKQYIDIPKTLVDKNIEKRFKKKEEEGNHTPELDEFGREIIDPRKKVVKVKELTQDQKIMNNYVVAQRKAALELENLPWDFSTPEAARKSLKEIFDLDMPEVEEFVSNYEVIPMAEDFHEVYGEAIGDEEIYSENTQSDSQGSVEGNSAGNASQGQQSDRSHEEAATEQGGK